MIRDFLQDLRYAARTLSRKPTFAVLVVLTLAMGLGANAAVFGLLDAVLLRPLAVRQPERLVQLSDGTFEGVTFDSVRPGRVAVFSSPLFEWFRQDVDSRMVFEGVAAQQVNRTRAAVSRPGVEESDTGQVAAARLVSANFFDVVGVRASRGRTFLPEDETAPGANAVAVLSHGYWQSRFGGDPAVVGSRIDINGYLYTVVGVGPPGFTSPRLGEETDLWVPLTMQSTLMRMPPLSEDRKTWWLLAVARMRPDVSLAAAKTRANLTLQQYLAADPDVKPELARRVHIEVEPGGHGRSSTRKKLRGPVLALMAGVGLLLFTVCLNLSHFILARAMRRRREMGIRTALGATSGRLLRQLLAEALLLVGLGSAAAVVTTRLLIDGLLSISPGWEVMDVRLDARLLAFGAALSSGAMLVLGLVPRWAASRTSLQETLWATGAAVAGGARSRFASRILLVSQVVLSLVLLVGAGLLTTTFARLRVQDNGFDQKRVLQATLLLQESGLDEREALRLSEDILRRVEALPGVHVASLSQGTGALLRAGAWSTDVHFPDGRRPGEALTGVVTSGYFETLGIRLLRGRSFTREDGPNAPTVALVSETLARRISGSVEAAVGQRLGFSPEEASRLLIVGVVADARTQSVREAPAAALYRPAAQAEGYLRGLLVRAIGDPAQLAGPIRRAVRDAHPRLTISTLVNLDEHIDRRLQQERMLATLATAFGLAALFLLCLGLYGVMAQWVGERNREIGLRMALGATGGGVRWLVIRQALSVVFAGVVVGIPAAIGAAYSFRSLLYGLTPTDPATLALATLVMSAAAIAGAYLPARGASRIDPMLALKQE